ncbi:MAG: AccI family restriction endonuclease [Acidobacteria bacterium]|nr:AccI family restriction endonuclease [Acidobacteriota bacterium]
MHCFELDLCVATEDIKLDFTGFPFLPWSDYLLNPRRLRGSDFLMRWSQGVWSEERVTQAVNQTEHYFALPYGPSGTAPDDDPRKFELYFERLEEAGLGKVKRPDLLIFPKAEAPLINSVVTDLGGVKELPFIPETNERIKTILSKALIAIECENSLWRANKMPNYNTPLTPQRRLAGKPGLKKAAVLPTVIVKGEDLHPLRSWQDQTGVNIHIWHIFYDLAFGISLNRVNELIADGLIEPTTQVFQAPGGATTKKTIYKIYHHYAYLLGQAEQEPELKPMHIEDSNGHILPFVKFEGGSLVLSQECLQVLGGIREEKANG